MTTKYPSIKHGLWLVLLAVASVATSGCTGTIRKTTTPRAAEEQFYVSTAAEQSVAQMDFLQLSGQRIFLDETYLKAIDKNYVVSLIREKAMIDGCKITKTKETAETIVELRSGCVGSYAKDNTIGIPSLLVPGSKIDNPNDLPILIELGYSPRQGWARIQAFAYERKTGRFVMGSDENFGYGYKGFIFDNIYPRTQFVDNLGENIR